MKALNEVSGCELETACEVSGSKGSLRVKERQKERDRRVATPQPTMPSDAIAMATYSSAHPNSYSSFASFASTNPQQLRPPTFTVPPAVAFRLNHSHLLHTGLPPQPLSPWAAHFGHLGTAPFAQPLSVPLYTAGVSSPTSNPQFGCLQSSRTNMCPDSVRNSVCVSGWSSGIDGLCNEQREMEPELQETEFIRPAMGYPLRDGNALNCLNPEEANPNTHDPQDPKAVEYSQEVLEADGESRPATAPSSHLPSNLGSAGSKGSANSGETQQSTGSPLSEPSTDNSNGSHSQLLKTFAPRADAARQNSNSNRPLVYEVVV